MLLILLMFQISFLKAEPRWCPASAVIDFDEIPVFQYPEMFYKLGECDPENSLVHNCTLWPLQRPGDLIHTKCLNNINCCPVSAENVKTALSVQNWTTNAHRLHQLLSQSNINQTITLTFLGGSMTAGSVTGEACCCNHVIDSTCNASFVCPKYPSVNGNSYCAWPGFFSKWFQSHFSNFNIQTSNKAQGGFSSFEMANIFQSVIGEYRFTSNDIVIVDHSANDAYQPLQGKRMKISIGLESLIRRIYHYSKEGETPIIILIEQYPHIHNKANDFLTPPPLNSVFDYTKIYRQLAEHYNLMLWSYREVLWSQYATVNQSHFSQALKSYDVHPSWSAHLFITDILSSCFIYTIQHEMKEAMGREKLIHIEPVTLPEPLFNISAFENKLCAPNEPMFLNAAANTTFRPVNLKEHEEHVGEKGWSQYIDYRVPGWIIDDRVISEDAKVLNFNIEYPSKFNHLSNLGVLIKIVYLRTYMNAGQASVYVCGIQVDKNYYLKRFGLDALWPDAQYFRISTPYVFTYDINDGIASVCDSLPVNERVVSIKYFNSTDHLLHRLHQKLKILDVQICLPER